MIKLGMGSYTTRANGVREFVLGATPSIQIKAIILPNIEVSGGSINVTTDNLKGNGILNASGVPKIDIENDSSAYLVTNQLTIGDKGGTINYNGTQVTNNSEINTLNSSKTGASFIRLRVSDSNGTPTITVSNNYAGSGSIPMKTNPKAPGYDTLDAKAKNEIFRYTPINYIEITKHVTNPVGNVIINSNQGSIRINSGAKVNAQSIEMKAKESISQGFTDGIVNISNTPEFVYADEAKKLRASIGWDSVMPTTNQTKTLTSNLTYNGDKGWIAGDAIYISARDININGLIQSGFENYKATINQSDLDNANTQVFFNGVSMYKVNNGGVKADSNGYYYYEPQLYYDRLNNKLYVEDINSTGGKIYLSGRILSTGNGKIVAGDGSANINITNNSDVDINFNNITRSGGNGFIQIIDTAQNKLVEYSSDQIRTINNYSEWLTDNSKGTVDLGKGLSIGEFTTYKPQQNLTYRWAEGVKQSTRYHYHKEEKRGRWGNADDPNYTGRYEDMTNTYNEVGKPETLDNAALPTGSFIYSGNQSANLTLYAQNTVDENNISYGIDRSAAEYTTSGFFGYYHHHQHYWNKEIPTVRTYVYSVKADYPISVGFIGSKTPKTTLTSKGDLYLSGDIKNDIGALNIESISGDIIQNAGINVSTDNINLIAKNNIRNIDIVARDKGNGESGK